jgi:hypothetical protein
MDRLYCCYGFAHYQIDAVRALNINVRCKFSIKMILLYHSLQKEVTYAR